MVNGMCLVFVGFFISDQLSSWVNFPFKVVVLVKLAFAMQRLKNIFKNFYHDQQRQGGKLLDFVGGHSSYERGHRAHSPLTLPTRENPASLMLLQ